MLVLYFLKLFPFVSNSPFFLMIRAIKHLLALLEPHSKENGGVLSVEHVRLVAGI